MREFLRDCADWEGSESDDDPEFPQASADPDCLLSCLLQDLMVLFLGAYV